MSKELVARALEHLVDGYVLSRAVLDDFDRSLTHISLGAPALAALIRAVDAQYPEGYDEQDGYVLLRVNGPSCADCFRSQTEGHDHDCLSWNTRVALLNLCLDILGEKE